MTMEKPVMSEKEAPVKGIVAQVVTMLNGQAQRYVDSSHLCKDKQSRKCTEFVIENISNIK